MTGNGLTERDKRLMVKYGFIGNVNDVPEACTVFAYRTFMAMQGDYFENGSGGTKPENTMGADFKAKNVPAWPYAV